MDRPFVEMEDLYRDVVLDHYRSPRGRDALDMVDARQEGFNPICGDEVEVAVEMKEGDIKNVQIRTRGCAISVASGSMLAEILPGLSEDEFELLSQRFRALLHGDPVDEQTDLGDLEALRGVAKFPVRVKCALLPWMTLREALRNYHEGDRSEPRTAEDPGGGQ